MKFNETLIYLVIFVVIYNLIGMLSLRLRSGRKGERPSSTTVWLVVSMTVTTIIFVAVSCYKAYLGFAETASGGGALFATIAFYGIVGLLLLVKVTKVVMLLFGSEKKVSDLFD